MSPTRRLPIVLSACVFLFAMVVDGSARAASEAGAAAQGGRAVRRAAPPRAGGVVVAAYYRPLFLPLYYDPFYDPWWFPYRYGAYPYGFGYGRFDGPGASLRVQVSPRDAEVFVDGYYAGIVDDYDGTFQRLHLEPGDHEITIYLSGFRSATHRIYLQPGRTLAIRDTLPPLQPGDAADPRPIPPPRATPSSTTPASGGQRAAETGRGDELVSGDARFGAIAIRVQPANADVFIDGERWDGPEDDEALVIQLMPGSHRIEVRRDGYRQYEGRIEVTTAETTPLNVSLSR